MSLSLYDNILHQTCITFILLAKLCCILRKFPLKPLISVACLRGSINDCDTIERVSMKVETDRMKYLVKQDLKFGSSPVSTGRVHRGFEVPRVLRQMDFSLNNH